MSASKGCPFSKFAISHFEQLEKVANKSGHYFWNCKYCPEGGSGRHLQNRDNKLAIHIANPIDCPNAPYDACAQARNLLMAAGHVLVDDTVLS